MAEQLARLAELNELDNVTIGALYLDKPHEIGRYDEAFTAIWGAALRQQDTQTLLHQGDGPAVGRTNGRCGAATGT
ncbi:hypothetical protein A8713_10755 [Streptomyces sp. SAT1]|uniref:hypothetical protein n=1 Tax=Streptomyces sp. SAT1 TaxID=1849967 RepID=UPI0007DD69D6|nr:hypothetical protein [Streptomyces sp. SAT1]ANH91592.1 hypothetical protein A8713_10755 [Streptomyces sp. SAT1]